MFTVYASACCNKNFRYNQRHCLLEIDYGGLCKELCENRSPLYLKIELNIARAINATADNTNTSLAQMLGSAMH